MRASSLSFFLERLAADLVGFVEGGEGTVEHPFGFYGESYESTGRYKILRKVHVLRNVSLQALVSLLRHRRV